jgi:hypothetical protein
MNYKRNTTAAATIDAGLGLIYRLNNLWRDADYAALQGDMDKYNDILNRIFVNLTYRGNMDIEYSEVDMDGKAKIKTVTWSEEDSLVYNKFKEIIRQVKRREREAIANKTRGLYNIAREDHYEILLKKDSWLRKLMMSKGLYLKEVEFDASRALWGG